MVVLNTVTWEDINMKDVDFESLSMGGLITLQSEEYQYIVKDIKTIIQEVLNSGREMHTTMRPSLLIANLMIGLNFVYTKNIDSAIIEIGSVKPGIMQIILHDTDYLVLESEIRQLI